MLVGILNGIVVFLGIITMVSILMQPSKTDALSGLIQGSNNETFFSKNKSRTKEVILARITMVSMILFSITILSITLLK